MFFFPFIQITLIYMKGKIVLTPNYICFMITGWFINHVTRSLCGTILTIVCGYKHAHNCLKGSLAQKVYQNSQFIAISWLNRLIEIRCLSDRLAANFSCVERQFLRVGLTNLAVYSSFGINVFHFLIKLKRIQILKSWLFWFNKIKSLNCMCFVVLQAPCKKAGCKHKKQV